MNRATFISLIFSASLGLIFLKIYQHNLYVGAVYERQKLELLRNTLELSMGGLTEQLYALKDRALIAQYAEETLGLKPVKASNLEEYRC